MKTLLPLLIITFLNADNLDMNYSKMSIDELLGLRSKIAL